MSVSNGKLMTLVVALMTIFAGVSATASWKMYDAVTTRLMKVEEWQHVHNQWANDQIVTRTMELAKLHEDLALINQRLESYAKNQEAIMDELGIPKYKRAQMGKEEK